MYPVKTCPSSSSISAFRASFPAPRTKPTSPSSVSAQHSNGRYLWPYCADQPVAFAIALTVTLHFKESSLPARRPRWVRGPPGSVLDDARFRANLLLPERAPEPRPAQGPADDDVLGPTHDAPRVAARDGRHGGRRAGDAEEAADDARACQRGHGIRTLLLTFRGPPGPGHTRPHASPGTGACAPPRLAPGTACRSGRRCRSEVRPTPCGVSLHASDRGVRAPCRARG